MAEGAGLSSASTTRQLRRWRWVSRIPRSVRVALALLLGAVGLLGLTTTLFRSNRAVVAGALTDLATPRDHEVRFLVDVRADPTRVRDAQFAHLEFRAGPGLLIRAEAGLPKASWPFRLVLEKPGVSLSFRGSTVIRDGVGYVRLTEMPPYKKLRDVLQGRWLQIGERREPASAAPRWQAADQRRVVEGLIERRVLRAVHARQRARVRGVSTRLYDLELDDGNLRAYLRDLPQQFPNQHGVAGAARYLEGRLAALRVDRARLWVRPWSGRLVRARLELVPRDASSAIRRVVAVVTLLPRTSGDVPAAPRGAVRLRPETLQKLVPP